MRRGSNATRGHRVATHSGAHFGVNGHEGCRPGPRIKLQQPAILGGGTPINNEAVELLANVVPADGDSFRSAVNSAEEEAAERAPRVQNEIGFRELPARRVTPVRRAPHRGRWPRQSQIFDQVLTVTKLGFLHVPHPPSPTSVIETTNPGPLMDLSTDLNGPLRGPRGLIYDPKWASKQSPSRAQKA